MSDSFWKRWSELYAPTLVRQSRWTKAARNLKEGDIVLIVDSGLKGTYKLARVVEVFPGPDSMVRKVKLAYKNYKPGEPVAKYDGSSDVVVTRSAQKLALVVAEEEKI